jgi:hypothetical protein
MESRRVVRDLIAMAIVAVLCFAAGQVLAHPLPLVSPRYVGG